MVIYKNDYTKERDETLWELHEIRNKLYKELKDKSVEKINRGAINKYLSWQKQRGKILVGR
ncbi:MAG: hypothetical protein AABY84_11035 [Candidatus Firestonebacteria bacterium]